MNLIVGVGHDKDVLARRNDVHGGSRKCKRPRYEVRAGRDEDAGDIAREGIDKHRARVLVHQLRRLRFRQD